MNRHIVFISYKAEERQQANWLREFLQDNGISCWMAPESIPGGLSYASEIPAAIRECCVFVLILSSLCQTSKWIPRELDQAINDNKIIMPFMIEDVPLRDDFRFYLTNVQRYEAYNSQDKAAWKLVCDIKAIMVTNNKQKESIKPLEAEQTSPEIPTKITAPVKYDAPKKSEKTSGKKRMMKWLIPCAAAFAVCTVGASIIYNNSVVEINGKNYRKNITELEITNKFINADDLSGIAELENLEELKLENCSIETDDLSAIAGTRLETLRITGCGLTDAQLSSIDFSKTNVRYLDLSENSSLSTLYGIEPLADTLTYLSINENSVSDIDALNGFVKLYDFKADNNAISDVSALSACEDLYSLSLNGNSITDISPLSTCEKLQMVYLNNNALTSLSGLEGSLSLRTIEAGFNKLENISGLDNATILENVFLSSNKLSDLELLSKSSGTIRKLYLSDNNISSDGFLAEMTALEYLSLDRNKLTDLYSLADCKELISLTAAGNEIKTTTGFEGLKKLRYLDLSDCNISIVGEKHPLSFDSSDGAVLDLSGNKLSEINISYDGRFKFISFKDADISNPDFLTSISASKLVIDYNDFVYPSILMLGDYNNSVILDCPADKQLEMADALSPNYIMFESGSEFDYDLKEYLPDISFGYDY